MDIVSKRKIKNNNSLGRLLSFEQFSDGFLGKTDNGNFRISFYSPEIARIHITREEDFDHFSYAVISEPGDSQFVLEEHNGDYHVHTSAFVLRISKDPVRFSFLTKEGTVINEDDPAFGTSWLGEQVTTYKVLQEEERFIGLGEKTGPLDKKGMGFLNWNTDSFAYHEEQDPLYSSIPFYIGLHSGLAYGIFMDNSHKSLFNFGASNNRFSSFAADAGDMNYYFIHSDNVAGIIKAYSELTGRTEIPPMWSLGYQQCRYSYYPEQEVYSLVETFRSKDIPADAIVFDIHYMDKYKIFSWDKKRFPHPEKMINDLQKAGFHTIVMCDPGIKIEEGYEPYEDGIEKDVFIKYPDGEPYSGEVWPGWCHFPDFTHPDTREWWGDKLSYYVNMGVTGFWNDMNEIATWGQNLPELMDIGLDGNGGTMREGRNLFGFQMARSTFEGAKKRMGGRRPFNLTRAGFAGIQRYSALWTGDNVSNEEHMLLGVRLLNSLGISGVPFTGYDVGGFSGNPSEHLFARWIQIGSFSPFFRGHTMINSRDSEPWTFGEEVEEISRNYIKLRYKLMVYLYSSFYEASTTAMPVVRSLAIDHAFEEEVYDERYHNQYYFGPSLMIAPVESFKDLARVYLPGETNWYELFTDRNYESGEVIAESPIQQLPVFVKASSILPVAPEIGHNTTELGDVLEIHLYHGKDDNTYTWYEDDGETYNFENGDFSKRVLSFKPSRKTFDISGVEGEFTSRFKTLRIMFHGFDPGKVSIDGQKKETANGPYRFIQPISSFDPQGKEAASHLKIDSLPYVELDNTRSAISINW